MIAPLGFLGAFGDAIEFIFEPQETRFTGGREVGGLDQVWELTATHLEVSAVALGSRWSSRCRSGSCSATSVAARCSRSRWATPFAGSRSWR